MSKPLVSIIASVYDGVKAKYLEKALLSIASQSYSNIELILVLDGVKRNDLLSIIKQYQSKIKMKIIKQFQRCGLAKAMNIGLKYVEGEFICRMDMDDISHPLRIEKQVEFLTKHPNIDVVGAWAIEIDENDVEVFRKRMPISHEECYKFFVKRDPLIHPTAMFRKNFFKKAGLYPEDTYLAEDTMLWANAFAAGCKFANIPEYLYYFRIDKDFYKRRRGLKAAWDIFRCRIKVNKKLKYPLISYIYALLYGLIRLTPSFMLALAYKKFR